MLAYILAIAVAFGSFIFYMAAFFFPEVHRKYDFLWGGVGLFYALVLWLCAGRITGGVLLGQTASVSLLGWLGWQTLTLRRTTTPPATQTEVSPEVEAKAKGFPASLLSPLLNRFRKPKTSSSSAVESVATLVEEETKLKAPLEEVSAPEVPPTSAVEPETAGETIETIESESSTIAPDVPSEAIAPREMEMAPDVPIEASEPGEVETEMEEETTETLTPPVPPEPPSAEMKQEAQPEEETGTATPVEEFAPEVELAPPAEPPRENE
ncbi:MAG: Ycf66 family protein [Cyanobacteriota bacterium]|nr:Ycf66 family protein [Cyanobacteriota bacterium]